MCLIAIFFRMVADAPLVVGANREELFVRGGEPPQILHGSVRCVAGVDPQAGGTWLGINEHSVLVAVTNRRKSNVPALPRSRGWLVRDLLNCKTVSQAVELAGIELGQNGYAGCNVVCADRDRAYVIHAGDWLRIRPLPAGIHVLTAHDVNDAADSRIGHSLWWLEQHPYQSSNECVAALQQLCGQTGNPGPPICLRQENGGTVSSSIIAIGTPLTQSAYWHCQGPPDKTPYENRSELLRVLFRMI